MAKLINAKCPNCGAILELPAKLDRAFCMHCGGKVIIAKDEIHHHAAKPAIACPSCKGSGFFHCYNCGYDFFRRKKETMKGICNDCGGNGICNKCNGNKICNWKITFAQQDSTYFGPFPNKIYSQCINGRCSHCNGTGKVSFLSWSVKVWDIGGSCGACSGTGVCPQCDGTGLCPKCDGTGLCPQCSGKGKCECGGTGKIKCEACNGTGFKVYQGE